MSEQLPLADAEPGCERRCGPLGFDRRDFLFVAGASLVALTIPGFFAGPVQAKVANYPRKKVGLLSKLKKGEPVEFRYPWDHANCNTVLLKLGQEAAGGVGPDKDVVAFNGLCPHMGWGHPGEEVLRRSGHRRPCPGHWTTFDLTRHGTVVSGHATHGDDVIAVEFEKHLGQPLIFGFYDNKTDTKA